MSTNGLNKYICKYIGNTDEKSYVIIFTGIHKNGNVVSESAFMHNTNIAL